MTTPLHMVGGRLVAPVNENDHVIGSPTAPVTLVEYGDFQCPFCGAAHPIVQEVLRRRQAVVRFVYRHFPLTNVHPYAESTAEAAEAASVRGRFWPVHDWLFEHQDRIDPRSLAAGLDDLGLDGPVIGAEAASHRYLSRVRSDFVGGVHSGVNGTPTFFINGHRHDGGYSSAELLRAVDEAAS
jgi:protein-disulfide isomerase